MKNKIKGFVFYVLLFVFVSCSSEVGLAQEVRQYSQNIIEYVSVFETERTVNLEGAFAGMSGELLIFAGGVQEGINPIEANEGKCIDMIRAYADGSVLQGTLEQSRGFGACVSTDMGVICIGGTNGREVFDDVSLIQIDEVNQEIEVRSLPSLPKGLAYCSATAFGGKIYVAGGAFDAKGQQRFTGMYVLDLAGENGKWIASGRNGYPGALFPAMGVQDDGFGDKIYLFGGYEDLSEYGSGDFGGEVFKYDPVKLHFSSVMEMPVSGQRAAVGVGQSHVFLYPMSRGEDVLAYHAITDSWAAIGDYAGPVEIFGAVKYLGDVRLIGLGAEGSVDIIQANVVLKNSHFGFLDYGCLVVYLVGLVLMGFYFSKREKSTNDFFLGGQRIPFWAAGLSLIGTGLSAITYIATPAKAYASDWHRLVMPLLMPLGIFVQIYLMLPFFRRLNVTTAYEYLEYRFNIVIRIFASLSFIILQLGRMGVVLFLPAIALSASTGMNVFMCILFMGILCTIYTVLGGIEAVIWTDVIQVIIFYSCAVMMLITIVFSLEGGVGEFYSISVSNSKFHMINPSWDLTTTSITVMILATFANVLLPMTDQTIVQRWLTTKDEKNARRAIVTGALIGIPSAVVFFLIGTALFAFYKTNPEKLNPELLTDGIVPWFAVQQLPAGISGLLIAAIFAASMSSMDSSMNSLATAIVTDFYRRFKTNVSDHHCLVLARWLTVLFGVFGTSMALLFASTDIKSLVDLISKYNGLFGGGLAGVFLLGMLTKRTNLFGSIVGILSSALAVYYVQAQTRVSFFLYFVVGLFTCMIMGYLASFITGGKISAPEGMTIYSLIKEKKE